MGSGKLKCEDQVRQYIPVIAGIPRDHVVAPLDAPLGRNRRQVPAAEHGLVQDAYIVEASAVDSYLGGLGVPKEVVDATGHKAQGRGDVQLRKPGVVDGFCGVDEFLSPCGGFVLLDPITQYRRITCDGGAGVEVTVVGGMPEGHTQIGHFDGEPRVGLTLSWAVPLREDVGFETCVVPGVGCSRLVGRAGGLESFFGELTNGL